MLEFIVKLVLTILVIVIIIAFIATVGSALSGAVDNISTVVQSLQ